MGYYLSVAVLWFLVSLSALSQTSYVLPATQEALDKSREVLYNSVGIKEYGGNNRGKEVDEMNALFGLRGAAWCQVLQYYCFWVTGEPVPIKKTAGSVDCFNDARQRGRKVDYRAEIDAIIIWRTVNSWPGHTGRLIKIGKNGWVHTIEGNTGSGINQRDGDGCYVRKRHLTNPIGRLRVLGTIIFEV